MLKMVGAEADRLGLECYVIGGYVRDLFLHRESTDIDVESSAPAYLWRRRWQRN